MKIFALFVGKGYVYVWDIKREDIDGICDQICGEWLENGQTK